VARIFLSYRRDDSSGHAGRFYDRLCQHFGRDNLFMDIDTIAPGLDVVEAIANAVGSCDVLLAVIGRQWLTCTDPEEHRRLDNPEDYVRLKITTALERRIRVIPVLVGGASMPRSTELSDELPPLVRRQALVVGDHFHPDVNRLIAALETVLGAASSSSAERPPDLSEAARELLLEAVQDCQGIILRMYNTHDGMAVKTHKRSFVEAGNVRPAALWRSAVDELHNLRLIEDRAREGTVFFVTDPGYKVSDLP
jgi:TIR domain